MCHWGSTHWGIITISNNTRYSPNQLSLLELLAANCLTSSTRSHFLQASNAWHSCSYVALVPNCCFHLLSIAIFCAGAESGVESNMAISSASGNTRNHRSNLAPVNNRSGYLNQMSIRAYLIQATMLLLLPCGGCVLHGGQQYGETKHTHTYTHTHTSGSPVSIMVFSPTSLDSLMSNNITT